MLARSPTPPLHPHYASEQLLEILGSRHSHPESISTKLHPLIVPCLEEFRQTPSLLRLPAFWQPFGSDSEQRNACAAYNFVSELVNVLRVSGSEKELYLRTNEILELLAKDSLWRELIAVFQVPLMEILALDLTKCTDKLPKLVTLLSIITYKSEVKCTAPDFVEILCDKIMTIETLNSEILGLFSNLCESEAFRNTLLSVSVLPRILRRLVKMLSDENLILVIYSLQILVQLVGCTSIIQNLFNDANVQEAWKLVVTILSKQNSQESCHEAAIDLLEFMFRQEKLVGTLKRYVSDTQVIRKLLLSLSKDEALLSQMCRFAAVMMENCKYSHQLLAVVLESDAVPKALEGIAQYCLEPKEKLVRGRNGQHDRGMQIRSSTVNACSFLRTVLIALENESVTQEEFDRLADQFIPSIPLLLDCLASALETVKEDQMNVEPENHESAQRLTQKELLELAQTIDVLITFPRFDLDEADMEAVDTERWISIALEIAVAYLWSNMKSGDACAAVFTLVTHLGETKKVPYALEFLSSDEVAKTLATIMRESSCCSTIERILALVARTTHCQQMLGRSLARLNISRAAEDWQEKDIVNNANNVDTNLGRVTACSKPKKRFELKEVDETLATLEKLEEELAITRENMRKEMELKDAISQRKISVHSNKSEFLKAELDRLTECLDQKTSALEQSEIANADMTQKVADLQRSLSEARHESSRIKGELIQMTEETNRYKKKNHETEQALACCREKLREVTDEAASATENIHRLEHEKDAQGKAHKARQKELQLEIQDLTHQLKELQAERALFQQTTVAQKARISTLEEKVKELQLELGDQEREHDEIVMKLAQSLNSLNLRKRKGVVAVGGKMKDEVDEELSSGQEP
ncbi:uncharacterized protein SPPG_03764 [Spizellomyces punctatus DAOM BR117]|uniref:CIP2A N-terminal domain-containing protein n=1 Tax=Spizellomyces punctatus (strain DAOM BR117) TaxID=645134 RepID=A0A0L0HHT0_SPIPD|nr:uncharacterized protein SPPG_03764 [Spizellomyces punctatus DAOM BR117]KND00638.1 hypothetical protein SPPG_03764 [Spizellomyces punctatus DAOM BR117]|eukprot:XP_016608677.1 hypothetical protein SPPG_03764 [Spizellomyces punctatus DAOM BR117]